MWLKLFVLLLVGFFSSCHSRHKPQKSLISSWAGGVYVVQKGDTLESIAKKKKVLVFDLIESNGIENGLKVGQHLYVPESDHWRASNKTVQKSALDPKDSRVIELYWPVKKGILFRSFDLNPDHLHEGVSLAAPKGTAVTAAQDGEVIYVGDDGTRYGRLVIVKHADPFVTIYAHLDQVLVTKNKQLKRYDILGTVGTSGGVDSPRLYFQVRKHRTPVDPELYLKHQ